jgi:hypothetical protein
VNFKPREEFDIRHTDYSTPSIVAEDALQRIVQQNIGPNTICSFPRLLSRL